MKVHACLIAILLSSGSLSLYAQSAEKSAADLRSTDRMTRVRASIALGKIGPSAVPLLIEAMQDRSWETRVAAANALRDLKAAGAPAVEALAENLRYSADKDLGFPPQIASSYSGSPSLQVRWAVITALGHIGPASLKAVPQLLECLRGTYESGLAAPNTPYLTKHWRTYEMRGSAAWVLQRLGPDAARQYPEVIPALAQAHTDPQRMVRLNAAFALRAMGPAAHSALPALAAALQHPDPFTRSYAALAFRPMGAAARPYMEALSRCHDSIRLDNLSRRRIRETIAALGGNISSLRDETITPRANRWKAFDRRDFLLVVQPFLDSSLLIDPDKLVDAFLDARMGNAITYWPDHVWYNTPPPTAAQLKHWGVSMLWYFFTEDIFNPKLQRDWAFATVHDYNRDLAEQILDSGRALGPSRALWAVGHEQMDQVRGWTYQADGTKKPPEFRTRREGYEFYRKWITTSIHTRHWMEYGNTRSSKFFDGWNTGAPATWEFISREKLDTSPVTMLSGGVSAALAHASFDILPQIGAYWWESQIDGASLQVGAAYASGAARQYNKKWLMDVSPWSRVHGGPGWGYENGKWTGGVTDEAQLRSWLYGYLSGASAVLEESSGSTHFKIEPYPDGPSDKPVITSTGKTAQKAAQFCFELCPDRGQSYRPVAVLLEHEHGFEPRPKTNFRLQGAWGYMPITEDEKEIEDFWYSAFPGHSAQPDKSKLGPNPDPRAMEHQILTESRFGDAFDVLTDHASLEVMLKYPRIVTLGGIRIEGALLARLRQYVAKGGQLMVARPHVAADASNDPLFQGNHPGVRVMSQRWNPASAGVLAEWIRPVWPFAVETTSGHAPQVALNKLGNNVWIVTIGNHWNQPWSGKVIARTNIASVSNVWSQTDRKPEGTSFQAEAGPFAFNIYRLRLSR